MAIEEPSVVASASHIAKLVREAGGFTAETTERMMIGQIQVLDCPDVEFSRQQLMAHEKTIVEQANNAHPAMAQRGGGAGGIEVRILEENHKDQKDGVLVLHLLVNTCDAMGANTINTMVESIAPLVETITGGKVHLRILSNYTDQCLARSKCVISSTGPGHQSAFGGSSGSPENSHGGRKPTDCH